MNAAPSSLALLIEKSPSADVLRIEEILQYGQSPEWIGIVAYQASGVAVQRLLDKYAKGKHQLMDWSQFHDLFVPRPPARVLHMGGFLDARIAWLRRCDGSIPFALCGVANRAMCQPMIFEAIGKLLTAPFEPYDALVCSSNAVKQLVGVVAESYAAHLSERHGGKPKLLPRIEVIPPGVDPEVFRPATPVERAQRREALGIASDAFVVICAGPLSFHSRANPFPIYNGLYQAARETKRTIHLLFAGSAPNAHIRKAFLDGARVFAPTVKTTVVDDSTTSSAQSNWHAADLCTVLSDSLSESCDKTILQAMACGLPVCASDWAGSRDIVVDGATGMLVPTRLMPEAISDATSRLLLNELSLDQFLARTSQVVVVDCDAATRAFTRLLSDDDLRQKCGVAGRERVLQHFTWERIVRRYDQLWQAQEAECVEQAKKPPSRKGKSKTPSTPPNARPSLFPTIESSFAGYPSEFFGDELEVQANPEMETRLHRLLNMALTQYEPHIRSEDPKLLREVLSATAKPCTIVSLDSLFRQAGVNRRQGRATVAWMLKYGVLQIPTGA